MLEAVTDLPDQFLGRAAGYLVEVRDARLIVVSYTTILLLFPEGKTAHRRGRETCGELEALLEEAVGLE